MRSRTHLHDLDGGGPGQERRFVLHVPVQIHGQCGLVAEGVLRVIGFADGGVSRCTCTYAISQVISVNHHPPPPPYVTTK